MNQIVGFDNQGNASVASIDKNQLIRKIRIENPLGLHARPAASIVRLLRDVQSNVTFTFKKQTVDARSVLGLLMLGAPKNAWITVVVDGPDANEALALIEEAFKNKFGEKM